MNFAHVAGMEETLFPIRFYSPLNESQMAAPTNQLLFLKNLNAEIERHLPDSQLNVPKLTRLVGMSYSNLHRKLVRAAGMSMMRYIRHKRLQNAAKLLLEHPDWTISQVALEVGFNSHSYFSKRFRDVFGVCPMEWRQWGGKT